MTKKHSKKLTALILTAFMGCGLCGSAEAANQTGTEFNKGQIDGKTLGFASGNDFKKYNVWDSATKTYNFDLDSTINTKSITGKDADVNVNAPDVTLTLNSKDNYGIQIYRDRKYQADPNNYARLHDVNITAKKLVLNIDRTTTSASANDAYGIVSASHHKNTATINGDVDINLQNKYLKDPDGTGEREPAVTDGIATIFHGNVVVNGDAKIRVRVPDQSSLGDASFLSHYFINGIFAGLNYDGDKHSHYSTPGSKIKVTGDVDIESDGTGIHAGGRSLITVGGGGRININKDHGFSHFSLNAEEATINMNVKLDAAGSVTGAGDRKTEIYGNIGLINREDSETILGDTPTRINLGLTTNDSVLHGIVHDDFKEFNRNEPDKKAIRDATGLNLYLQNGAAWTNESWGALVPTTPWNNIVRSFTGSKVTWLHGGADADHAGKILQKDARPITINHYDGFTNVYYDRTAPDSSAFTGGNFIVKNAAAGSSVTLRTSGNGLAAEKYDETFEALANKFFYEGYKNGEKNITGKVEIAEGAITPEASRTVFYNTATGQATIKRQNISYGPKETLIMSSVKSAMASSAMAFRAEANDLMKRMGDLRLSPEQIGTWVRFYRGRTSSDKDRTNFHMNYHTVQVGYDRQVSPQWHVGIAGSYMKGSAGFASGSGRTKEGNFGVYGTWTGKKGDYVDMIAKIGRLSNEYSVYNTSGDHVRGDYHTWAGSLSAEYGKRIKYKGGSFIEPQVELIYTHLNSADYKASLNGVPNSLDIRQGAMDSLIGRIGIGFGQETAHSTYFAKLSLYHEFAGGMQTAFSDSLNTNHTSQDFKDTWVGAQIGGTLKLSDNCSVYGDFEKTFAGDIKTDWRVDAGIRWGF